MKITIFGGSGGIGKFIIQHALNQGYDVVAMDKFPENIPFSDPKLEVRKGELENYQKIHDAILGADAVISSLGPPLKYSYKGTQILSGHQNMIKAMKSTNTSRLITIGTPSIKFQKDIPSMVTIIPGIMAKIAFPGAYKEIVQVGESVKASQLNWAIVRFLAPRNIPTTRTVKVTFGDKKISFPIAREDIALFMLSQINDATYYQSMPIIGN